MQIITFVGGMIHTHVHWMYTGYTYKLHGETCFRRLMCFEKVWGHYIPSSHGHRLHGPMF